ncbi:helix-turn-helix transcriptional regulator [Frigoribacterium faeni]|uniref:helix-turn-helix transcriptional regulator n=1 Tax=Frigoribacterium faeni TaxID=145483 RepID=UPI00141B8751|nr:helix-turn-helix transcriptional regulator [Frigoribacterium faeni]NIJ05482.1 transcriptional regulator with XRE-family HTH domain [Frigoribacterium faeni]
MDDKTQVREFLVSRRGRITPEQAGLPAYGTTRRVSGLRREEVAMLAGVSVDYYVRLERGNLSGVSESVLEALARALQLSEAERAHLFDLARTANASPTARRRVTTRRVRPQVQQMLDALGSPAWVRNGRGDFLAGNVLGRALYSEIFRDPVRPANTIRYTFLSPRARDFFVDWESTADASVAILRAEAGRDPHDRALSDLVGELATRSEDFRVRWAAHDVAFHRTGFKRVHHPVVGRLDLDFEGMELTADVGLTVFVYSAEPGTVSAERLALLASWALSEAGEAKEAAVQSPAPDAV